MMPTVPENGGRDTNHHESVEEAVDAIRGTTETETEWLTTTTARLLYEALVERSPFLVCLSDLSGTITFVSNAVEDLLGYEPSELVGQKVGMIVDAEAVQRARDALRGALNDEEVVVERIPLLHKNGTVITAQTTMVVVRDADGAPLVITTSRVPVDEQGSRLLYRATERMETLGQMSTAIAHDFNNLLLPMLGYAQLALMQIRDDQSELRHHVESIQGAAERSRDLIRRMLKLSEPEPDTQSELADIGDVVSSALPLLQMLLGPAVKLEHVSTSTDTLCQADPTRITQLVMNLAANARDALPASDASVRISTGRSAPVAARLSEAPAVEYVTLAFADNGSGMDEATQARVFEPYFTTKGEDGTGLGLATVDRIVRESGGKLELESAVGEGTRFVISLPAASGHSVRR